MRDTTTEAGTTCEGEMRDSAHPSTAEQSIVPAAAAAHIVDDNLGMKEGKRTERLSTARGETGVTGHLATPRAWRSQSWMA